MKLEITQSAKEKLNEIPNGKIMQLSLDRGSCDIVNNLYEIKVVENRESDSTENIIQSDDLTFIIDDDFEDLYEHELTIDFKNNFFVFKNKNQTFNNRIGLRYV
ncbi:iron-sulfur cluster biosynthesis family protein [Rossellomorea aquimaris]|uniref:Iron-sulfur cluster assembly protein n=1 Tax=Rossellomorea aquimaris TaxID=189382 RepID=A0A366EZJ5_9BACI|nr:iron-sulfur cluster biosynthesis family protein [Rossellomorea aquimaris]RBP07842.1 iron-sulfur cluster assembly protein [Rossellomorea aquimaris]